MSAAPLPILPPPPAEPPPAPRGAQWLDVPDAARRSGLSVGQLRRKCLTVWHAGGLAELRRPPGGGKPVWYVRDDADPALARVRPAALVGADLRKYPEAKRRQALGRKALLDAWEADLAAAPRGTTERQVTDRLLARLAAEGRAVSRATLYNWRAAHRAEGLEGLVDGRGREAAPWADHPFLEEVKRLYLSTRQPKLTTCVEIASLRADERGWPKLSYSRVHAFVRALPAALVLKLRHGEKAYVDGAEPYLERDYSALATNDLWNADHHQFDVIVNCGTAAAPVLKRPWLSAWQDCRSRMVVGCVVRAEDPNTDAVLVALDRAVRACGTPLRAHVDNGKDFDSYALHGRTKAQRRKVRVTLDGPRLGGVFGALSIDARNVQPYHGQSKPIERFFGTLEDRFGRAWGTYCGNRPENKPQGLPAALERGEAPLLADFVAAFDAWLDADYHARPHAGDSMGGRSPRDVYAACLAQVRTAPPELLDLLLLKPTRPVKVGQNGVTWGGLRYGAGDRALFPWLGREVTLRVDDRDLSRVQVYAPDGRFVCVAAANARVPANATSDDLRDSIRAKRRHRKIVAEYVDARPRMADDLPDLLTRAAAARHARAAAAAGPADPPPPPPSVRPLRSPLEDQMPAIRRAMEARPALRIAAGAEDLDAAQIAGAFRHAADARAAGDAAAAADFDAFADLSRALRRPDDDDP